ncbi:MAG: preprotein translocase subunit YajC [Aerococcaceae bacterium]|nr:preprotein translocase subunit YajC [Aerococcaceae bacterium]
MELLLTIVPMGIMMYFFVLRPQKKAAEQKNQMLSALKKGDAVVTIGGLHGMIDEVDTNRRVVVLDCEGIYLTFELGAIAQVKQTVQSGPTPLEEVATTNAIIEN